MTMSPRVESRVQESHLGAHGRRARPAILLARFFGARRPIPIHSEGSGSGVGSSPAHPRTRFSVSESNDMKQVVQKNGRDAVRATSAVCDTRKFRMGKLGWRAGRSALVVSRGCAILPLPPDIREPSPRRRPPGPRR